MPSALHALLVAFCVELAMENPGLAILSARAHAKTRGGMEISKAAFVAFNQMEDKRAGICLDVLVGMLDREGRRALESIMKSDYIIEVDGLRHELEHPMIRKAWKALRDAERIREAARKTQQEFAQTRQELERIRQESEQRAKQAREEVRKGLAQGRSEGRLAGEVRARRETLLAILRARRIPVGRENRARVSACKDAAQLDAWIAQAAVATVIDEVFARQGRRTRERTPAHESRPRKQRTARA